jgi:superfamily I DNA/RNA helicase
MRTNPADWRPRDIQDLEPAAWAALRAGTASVTAGPGAGKSEFLAQRAGYLLETGLCRVPQQILAISFKRDAAANLRQRLRSRLPEYSERVSSMTFDAFTKSIVDRFKSVLPPAWAMRDTYRIGFASQDEVREFTRSLAATAPPEFRSSIQAMRPAEFIANVIGSYELAVAPQDPVDAVDYAVQQWWRQKYRIHDVPTVDFVMLNRLAELIIRSSPQLRRALVATYPYVFVDEFQDTTYAQYSFLKSVFAHTGATITVVGDRKQRIMGWAGALDDAFAQFEHDFDAERFELAWNFRSTQDLVDLQHRFATRLDASARQQVSQVVNQVGESPVQIWSFSNTRLEAQSIAAWIAADIEQSRRRPTDYALIARQRVDVLEPEFGQALAAQGLRLRNDDERIGDLRLQDLLKDDLARLLIGLVRLGATRGGQPQTWRDVNASLSRVAPPDHNRDVGSSVEDALSAFLGELREWFAATPLEGVARTAPQRQQLAGALIGKLTAFIDYEKIAQKRVLADRPEDLATTLEAFTIRTANVVGRIQAWDQLANVFAEDDAVPLLTIHRSKGLEYRTVFFIGLDDDQWWSHARDTVQSTMAFFVGVSRAGERLVFTQCDQRGSTGNIADLYEVLRQAGIPFVRMG